jgi:hypothetical protein
MFQDDYENDQKFLAIRSRIVAAWKSKKESGVSPIESMINKRTVCEEILKEPIAILDEIIKAVGLDAL